MIIRSTIYELSTEPMLITETEIRHHIRTRAERFVEKFGHEASMVEEFEVGSGSARIDMAFIGMSMLGIEIKSPKDSLIRLPNQSSAFSRYFDYLMLVTDEKFVLEAEEIIPHWWGITSIRKFDNNRVYFRQIRHMQQNPELDIESLINLLWKDELLSLISNLLGIKANPRKAKKELRKQLLNSGDLQKVKESSVTALKQRADWRSILLGAST